MSSNIFGKPYNRSRQQVDRLLSAEQLGREAFFNPDPDMAQEVAETWLARDISTLRLADELRSRFDLGYEEAEFIAAGAAARDARRRYGRRVTVDVVQAPASRAGLLVALALIAGLLVALALMLGGLAL